MSNQHVLKIHPAPLADLLSGIKTAEVRRNDRGFQVGDTVRLMEVNPETGNWTGSAEHVRTITHIQTDYGLPDGMCVLSCAQAGMELVGYANFDRLDNMLDDRTATVFPDRSSYAGTPVYRARAAIATQPAAGEPVAPIGYANPKHLARMAAGEMGSVSVLAERSPDENHTAPVFGAPPAAAHGDEAVRIGKLLELADRHAERRLADARSDEAAAAELESSEENEAGNWYGACISAADTARASAAIIKSLTDEIRSRAAMRAQGDGGSSDA